MMKMKTLGRWGTAVLSAGAVCLVTATARAQTVLYDNFGPGDTYNNGPGYAWGVEETNAAALFTPATDGVANTAVFAATIWQTFGAFTDGIPVAIYANVGGVPGNTALSVGGAFHYPDGAPNNVRTASFTPIFLSSSQSYFFTIGAYAQSDGFNSNAYGGWFANSTGATGVATNPTFTGSVWTAFPDGTTPTLRIIAAPEPTSAVLGVMALLTIGLTASKMQRHRTREARTWRGQQCNK